MYDETIDLIFQARDEKLIPDVEFVRLISKVPTLMTKPTKFKKFKRNLERRIDKLQKNASQ